MPVLFLVSLSACWTSPDRPAPPPTEDRAAAELVEQIASLRQEVLDLQDRVTELEAAAAVEAADMPSELDAYVTVRELDDTLTRFLDRDALDAELDASVHRDELDARLAAFPTAHDLASVRADALRRDELYAVLHDFPTSAEVDARVARLVTQEDLAQRLDDMATRTWVDEEIRPLFGLALLNAGLITQDQALLVVPTAPVRPR